MSLNLTMQVVLIAVATACCTDLLSAGASTADHKPNFVVIYCDNLGYGDIGCFGSTKHRTPNIDQLASEGLKLTSFYSTSGVCSPSRASLMTACYPRRVGFDKTDPDGAVLRPVSPNGLNPDETTIAEVLHDAGYTTAIIGKWHLGDQPEFLPTRQGFDEYFGIPYSDDMTPRPGQNWPPLPLMDGENVIEAPVDRSLLTRRYTERAIDFITRNRNRPFFLYLPHATPGSTTAPEVSEAFQGRSKNGPWGDSVEEIDWSTGEILKSLKQLNLDDRTLIVWTSDNGAPRRNPPQGSNLPLSGWGYTTQEGGMRVPCIARWPGKIPAGSTSDELCSTMDLLPTFALLSGAMLPKETIDGRDIRPLLQTPQNAKSPYKAFYYYQLDQLQAVRSGHWKLYLPLEKKRVGLSDSTQPSPARLYDLAGDLGESTDIADQHPEVVRRLLQYADEARTDLGDGDQPGSGQRRVGRHKHPTPRLLSIASP